MFTHFHKDINNLNVVGKQHWFWDIDYSIQYVKMSTANASLTFLSSYQMDALKNWVKLESCKVSISRVLTWHFIKGDFIWDFISPSMNNDPATKQALSDIVNAYFDSH